MSCDTISESYSKKKISFAGGPCKAGLNGKGRRRPLPVFLGFSWPLLFPRAAEFFRGGLPLNIEKNDLSRQFPRFFGVDLEVSCHRSDESTI